MLPNELLDHRGEILRLATDRVLRAMAHHTTPTTDPSLCSCQAAIGCGRCP
jgi:hypothetical protein